jgi:hypothetical protein
VTKANRFAFALLASVTFRPQVTSAQVNPPFKPEMSGGYVRQITEEDYRQELDRLQTVVDNCSHELPDQTTAHKACDPSLVGPDVVVSIATGKRTLQYAWLRDSLRDSALAESKEKDSSTRKQASTELREDSARLEEMAQEITSPHPGGYTPGNVSDVRRMLDTILASGDYPQAKPPSFWQRIWNEFLRWLLKALSSVMPSGPSTTAIYLLELTVIAIPCGLLIWWFVRKLQIQRLGLAQNSAPHPSAPSAQDWREWLEHGRRLGREGRWREAIHRVYWSAISCLESRRLWPADRTRTPREYLRLLDGSPEMRGDLFSLTRSFEHTWYGERPAGEKEFQEACSVLERIAAR